MSKIDYMIVERGHSSIIVDTYLKALSIAEANSQYSKSDVIIYMVEEDVEKTFTYFDKILTMHPHPKVLHEFSSRAK